MRGGATIDISDIEAQRPAPLLSHARLRFRRRGRGAEDDGPSLATRIASKRASLLERLIHKFLKPAAMAGVGPQFSEVAWLAPLLQRIEDGASTAERRVREIRHGGAAELIRNVRI